MKESQQTIIENTKYWEDEKHEYKIETWSTYFTDKSAGVRERILKKQIVYRFYRRKTKWKLSPNATIVEPIGKTLYA